MGNQNPDFHDGIITWTITGQLTQPDLAVAQKATADLIRKHGHVRILVLAEKFTGWAKTGDWGDLSFQIDNDRNIVKVAVVVDQQWEDLMDAFIGKGLRQFPVECFRPSDRSEAVKWLSQT